MIYDEGFDPHEDTWAEQVELARREARARRRDKAVTHAVGYALVSAAVVAAWLLWLN